MKTETIDFTCSVCRQHIVKPVQVPGGAGYAINKEGEKICYSCADSMQREGMKDRSRPFGCYVSSDEKTVATWTGGHLGKITRYKRGNSGFGNANLTAYRVLDAHGKAWYGRGLGAGMCLTLRAMKA